MSNYFWNKLRQSLPSSQPGAGARRTPNRRSPRLRRLQLEQLEDRIVPSLTLLGHYTGLDSAGVGGGGEPPDTQAAGGPSSVIETVNQGIGIYTPKNTGTSPVTDTLNDFFFTKGGLAHLPVASGDQEAQSDPFTLYDPQVQRFIVENLDFEVDSSGNTVNGGQNAMLIAVSKSSTPKTLTNSDWYFYEVNTTESGVALQDYPGNPGYNADALVVTLNSFSNSADLHTLVTAISMSTLISGGTLTKGTNFFETDYSAEFLPRPATEPDSAAGSPEWMVAAPGSGGQSITGQANTIDVVKMTNVLSANPTFTVTTLTVNPYFGAVNPQDPKGPITGNGYIDSRIMKTAERNGLLVAGQTTSNSAGNLDNASWYEINVSSGTPTVVEQGAVSGGPNVYDTYPAVDINAQGDIGMVFQSSGTAAGKFESIYATGRTPSDAPGTMETPVLIQAGTAAYTGTRQGDMTGINVDSDGSFWVAAEWANGEAAPNWGTAIGHFSLESPITIILPSAVEGQPLTNVPVATFLDVSGVSVGTYRATLNWGDGTTSIGRVVATSTADEFEILGSHTYAEEGDYTLTVSVNNGKATIGPVSGIVTVEDAPLTGFAQALNGQTAGFVNNALVAVFSDTDPSPETASNYSATIQWFEGNGLSFSSVGTITHLFNNTFAVYGSTPYTYPSGGLFTVRVFVHDVGGAVGTVNSVISVSNNPAIPPLVPQVTADTGPVNSQFVSMQDTLTNLLTAERLFFSAMTLGTLSEKLGAFGNLVNAFFAYEAAILAYDMQLPGS